MTEDDDEELVAYLDGELEPDEASIVESRIAADAKARSQAESLRKTYDLLDYLPKSEPSPEFASRTLTKLDAASAPFVVSKTSSVASVWPESPPQSRSWYVFGIWTALALLSGGLGYFGHLLAKPHFETKSAPAAIQQLRLLELLPLFIGVDDLAYLKALDESGLFSDLDEPPHSTVATTSNEELTKLDELFRKLPPARQTQLRTLDEDYHALDPAVRAKLLVTLERYATWLNRLPDKDRREIYAAPAGKERLETVRLVKNRHWRDSLPESWQQRVKNAADVEERDRIYSEYRRFEAERRVEWLRARQEWSNADRTSKPFPFDNAELALQVEDFVTTVLKPRLQPFEIGLLEELRREIGTGGYFTWLRYGGNILDMADKHPSLPEPKTGKPLTRWDDFPQDFLRKLRPAAAVLKPAKRDFRDLPQNGKWPEFAELIAKEAAERNVPIPVTLGPCRPGEFKPEVDEVLSLLQKKLTLKEKTDLENQVGKWPQYPKLFLDLARRHDLPVPGVTLPGLPSSWAKVYSIKPRRP